jgi:hypothetical protein
MAVGGSMVTHVKTIVTQNLLALLCIIFDIFRNTGMHRE